MLLIEVLIDYWGTAGEGNWNFFKLQNQKPLFPHGFDTGFL
jgi:hypothetical protein